jgi:nitroreductase
MEVREAIQKRRSVRSYKPIEIPEERLKRVLEAARLAPSAHNDQDWKFVVVRDMKTRKRLAEAANYQDFIAEAPVLIIAVALNPERFMSSGIPSCAINLSIAVDHMTLQAQEEGLGTCWIGAFSQEKVRDILNIPEKYKVIALLPLGFPADSPRPKRRKSLEEIICYETFSEQSP